MSGKLVVALVLAVVVTILLAGLYTLWKGGDTAVSWSNRLMRWRVLAQFVAIVVIMTVLYFSRH